MVCRFTKLKCTFIFRLKPMTDWHMTMIVATMVGIGVLLLTIGTAVSDLRGTVMKEINNENPQGTAVSCYLHR